MGQSKPYPTIRVPLTDFRSQIIYNCNLLNVRQYHALNGVRRPDSSSIIMKRNSQMGAIADVIDETVGAAMGSFFNEFNLYNLLVAILSAVVTLLRRATLLLKADKAQYKT
jgi:uncharacterized membrane protein YeaQ/YmgE (transglycosylase-associated protein family)